MTREEELTKIIDELIVLFCLRDHMDFNVVDRALTEIAQTLRDNPQHPITMSLHDYMIEKDFIQKDI